MNEGFINKVKELILKHLQDEGFDVSSLASKIGCSRFTLNRKVKFITGKSVNKLIRETRLQEAAKLIKSQDLTASEVAYRVGYSSPQYFNKCFHDYYGLTPGELKNKPDEEISPVKRYNVKNVLVFVSILIVVLFVIGYQFTKNDYIASIYKDSQSIVVLPFTDLTENSSEAWWCEGMKEQIINKFSKSGDLIVVEGPSFEAFKENRKTITGIVKELGVDNALTGSIRHSFDSIFVTVRLIDANGINLWNHTYKSEDASDFYIQQDIAFQVLNHLKIELNQDEKESFKETLSENFEANQYFKKGLFYHESAHPKDIKKSIELFNEAIKIDAAFANAYAYLGNMYVYSTKDGATLSQFMRKDSAKILALYNLNRALELDPKCFMSYIGLAELYMWERNIAKTQENFEKAFEINPNHVELNEKLAYFYHYFSIPKDFEKFLFHIEKAYLGKPTSPLIISKMIMAYLLNGDIQSAEKYYLEKGDLLSINQKFEANGLINSYKVKDFTEVIKSYEEGIKKYPNNSELYIELARNYLGVQVDRSIALIYAEKAYQLDNSNRLAAFIYLSLLIENKKISKAFVLKNRLDSLDFINETNQNFFLSQIKLFNGNYTDALNLINELPEEYILTRARINFLMGDSLKVKKILKEYSPKYSRTKAGKFALLKQRDSMYYFLDRLVDFDVLLAANSNICYDIYRHEPRYKAFLRKKYLPVIENYNGLILPVANSQHKEK